MDHNSLYRQPYRQAVQEPERGKRVSLRGELDQLEQEMRQLQIEFEKFFNGAEAVPPDEMKRKLQEKIRRLQSRRVGSVDAFRLNALEARFNSYSEMFNRRVRDLEEGRSQRARRDAAARPDSAFDVAGGVLVGREVEDAAAEALYTGLARSGNAPKFDLASFGSYLERQVDLIRRKTGCDQVQFRVVEDDGKMRLKAKPVRG